MTDMGQEALNALAEAALGNDDASTAFIIGYKMGRRAEPCAEQVEAGARAIWAREQANMTVPFPFDELPEENKRQYRERARIVLDAAWMRMSADE